MMQQDLSISEKDEKADPWSYHRLLPMQKMVSAAVQTAEGALAGSTGYAAENE